MEISAILESGMLILGLTEVIKRLLPERFWHRLAPLVAVLIGGLTHVYFYGYSPETVLYGLALGLSVTGLYKMSQKEASTVQTVNSTGVTVHRTKVK